MERSVYGSITEKPQFDSREDEKEFYVLHKPPGQL
jgi:hypothetical protein